MIQPFTLLLNMRIYRRVTKLTLVWLLLSLSLQVFAQQREQDPLLTIADPYENIEFFTIRQDLHLSADAFVQQHLTPLNLAPNSTMKFVRKEEDQQVKGLVHYRYQQYVNDIRVEGGEMIVHEQQGRVKYVNGQYFQNKQGSFATVPVVSTEHALQTALQQIHSTDYLWQNAEAEAALKEIKKDPNASYLPKAELVYAATKEITPEKRSYVLCWKYNINVNPVVESYAVYINAENGSVFNQIPLVFNCSAGSGTTIWNGVRTINTQLSAGSYRTIDDCVSAQIHTKNGNGANTGVGSTYYTDVDNSWPNTTLGQYIVQTHWSMRETRNYYFNVHGRNGIDNAGHDFTSYLNPGFTNNAYYSSSTETFSFGGSSTGTSPVIELDVAAHEATHGVINFTSNLAYQLESGALNESFADIFGETAEDNSLGTHDWIIANNIALGPLRSFISPNSFSDPDCYTGSFWVNQVGCVPAGGSGGNDYCGVHTNSGVQNYWYYLLSQGGSGTNDLGNPFTVTGIGIDKAKLIAYQCMINLTTNSTFANARSVSIQAAKDLYGNCSEEAEQTTRAWHAVGVGSNWVNPAPISIFVSPSAPDICSGSSVTVTASGALTYSWSAGLGSGSSKVLSPMVTSTYTVTGTDAEDCTGTKSVSVFVHDLPTVTPSAIDDNLCPEQTTLLLANSNGTLNTLLTDMSGGNGFSANVFDVHANVSITITDFQMNITSGDSAEVWYNPGGYGNANVTSTAGWIKLGSTVPITAMGIGQLTTIPTTSNLTIPAGSTYGIIVACNGSNVYTNGTLVGSVLESNPDLYITQGHGGGAFGGTFNLVNAPRTFNGSIIYRTNFTSYSWANGFTLSSTTSANPVASPTANTTYTLTATDGNGCSNTGTVTVYLNSAPDFTSVTATPASYCIGGSSQLNVAATSIEANQFLGTTLISNNSLSGNVFNITPNKDITITSVQMNISSTATQAEVWYKAGGYGNTSLSSSVGWTKLGATVTINPVGVGFYTTIPLTASLNIPAGQTYGLAVVCDGVAYYLNGTAVGDEAASNPDLTIYQGHGGSGMGGTFNFFASPRIWNGRIFYTVDNNVLNYSWSSGFLNNTAIANPITTTPATKLYNVTATDANGCTSSTSLRVIVEPKPTIQLTTTPNSACPGSNTQINMTANLTERDSLFTTLDANNGFGPNGGVVFDIVASKNITIQNVRMNIDTGATQAEVWYKSGGYGSGNLTSNAGWTKLGSTVSITPAGSGELTLIPITNTLFVSSGSTFGLAVVTNGSVNYSNGSLVGSDAASNPDLTIKEGHGGSGFGGTFNFTNSPRIFNGEITYIATNSLTGYSWTPTSAISNPAIFNPVVSPTANTIYSVTVTDNNGCTSSAAIGIQVMNTPTGTAVASPSSLCLGGNVNLAYTPNTGNQCNGVVQAGFAGVYAPANWTTTLTNSNGSVVTNAPSDITLNSSNGLTGLGVTGYQITVPCSGYVTFNWEYNTIDAGPQYDYPRYAINGGTAVAFPGFIGQNGYPKLQKGTLSIFVTAGQTLQLQAVSSDNVGGACSIKITNFKAPYSTTTTQNVAWYSAATGGSFLGNTASLNVTPIAASSVTYYAQVTNAQTGCTNALRIPTNVVNVNAIPSISAAATNATICSGNSTTLNATGAATYSWQPGALSGASVNVTPLTTTTYTVTGTTLAGCTSSTTVLVTVNPLPTVSTTISNATICNGQSTSITASGATTYSWQPGGLSGTTVNVTPAATTTYTVTGTAPNGCTSTATRLVTVNPLPTVSTTISNATICNGQSTSITASGASTYSWQPGGLSGTTVNVTPAATTTYTVTGTAPNGCTATTTRLVTVNSSPTVSTTISNATICNGQSTSITASGATTYSWQPGGLTGTTVNVTPASTTTYTVTGTAPNGCTSNATRLVTVNALPNVTVSATFLNINCPNSTTLTASGANTYAWQPGGLSGASVVVTPATTTIYTVTGTAPSGCTKTASITITVVPCSSATLNIKALIEGYYIGGGQMTPVLNNQGLANPTTQADSLTVELHQAVFPYNTVASFKGVQLVNGNMACSFPASIIGSSHYIVLKHRNVLETWSANPVLASSNYTYNFTTAANKAFGNNQVNLGGGVFGLFSGDVNQDLAIDAFDYLVMEPDIQAGNFGYLTTDLNGDGSVDAFDYLLLDPNISNGVGAATP